MIDEPLDELQDKQDTSTWHQPTGVLNTPTPYTPPVGLEAAAVQATVVEYGFVVRHVHDVERVVLERPGAVEVVQQLCPLGVGVCAVFEAGRHEPVGGRGRNVPEHPERPVGGVVAAGVHGAGGADLGHEHDHPDVDVSRRGRPRRGSCTRDWATAPPTAGGGSTSRPTPTPRTSTHRRRKCWLPALVTGIFTLGAHTSSHCSPTSTSRPLGGDQERPGVEIPYSELADSPPASRRRPPHSPPRRRSRRRWRRAARRTRTSRQRWLRIEHLEHSGRPRVDHPQGPVQSSAAKLFSRRWP